MQGIERVLLAVAASGLLFSLGSHGEEILRRRWRLALIVQIDMRKQFKSFLIDKTRYPDASSSEIQGIRIVVLCFGGRPRLVLRTAHVPRGILPEIRD